MGRFIISRSALGDRFLLQSESGRVLAVSRDYATLDACKKGICSLVSCLATAPLVDAAVGEQGANPKCELTSVGGRYLYTIKAPNGRSLYTSALMQTRKAALRALTMLRQEAAGAEVLLLQPEGYLPLTVHVEGAAPSTSTAQGTPPVSELPAPAAPEPSATPRTLPAQGITRPAELSLQQEETAPSLEVFDLTPEPESPELTPETPAPAASEPPAAPMPEPPTPSEGGEAEGKRRFFGRIHRLR